MLLSKIAKRFHKIKIPIAKNSLYTGTMMCTKKTYENAISALNSLQTNSASLSISIKMKQQHIHDEANMNLRETEKFLERIDGFSMKALDSLSVIHVSGSKGKGSVCTFTDAILREYNVKTGLFTSPHLVSVTERIKLMGRPINKAMFNKYFWEVYDSLVRKKNHEHDLPSYFKFLQIMAFYIFVKEKVDCVICEVGIGGTYDSTNIIRNTEIVGITALQLEHTQLLGNTIEEIAWQKTGIIKKDSYVYYMNQSNDSATDVIKRRFKELGGKRLSCSPQFDEYLWQNCIVPDFKHTSEINKINFSLAAQLSARWLRNRNLLSEKYFNDNVLINVESKFIWAIQKCQFEGRFQEIKSEDITFYLDGAHTRDSMCITADWFFARTNTTESCMNILIFNLTGDRDPELILEPLHEIPFDVICFTTNLESEDTTTQNENFSDTNQKIQFNRCARHKKIWLKMCTERRKSKTIVECFPTIQSVLDYIYKIKDNNATPLNVLITGSLHLVGGSLKVIKNEQNHVVHEDISERIVT